MKKAPSDFSRFKENYRYDVIFLLNGLSSKNLLKKVKIRKGVDSVWSSNKVLYFSRLAKNAAKSYLSKIIQLPEYKEMTIRNWNTTTKLYELIKNNSKDQS